VCSFDFWYLLILFIHWIVFERLPEILVAQTMHLDEVSYDFGEMSQSVDKILPILQTSRLVLYVCILWQYDYVFILYQLQLLQVFKSGVNGRGKFVQYKCFNLAIKALEKNCAFVNISVRPFSFPSYHSFFSFLCSIIIFLHLFY